MSLLFYSKHKER